MTAKKGGMLIVVVVLQLILIDVLCSYFLFYFFELRGFDRPNFTYNTGRAPLLVFGSMMHAAVVRHLSPVTEQCQSHAEPKFYHPDDVYGYGHAPGRYVFTFCPNETTPKKAYRWEVNIDADLSRRTSHTAVTQANRIFIFGDSWIFGWGLNDEQTMSWLLQDYFRDNSTVRNYAHSGGGTIQGLIKYRALKDQMGPNDILLFGYADYYGVRDVAAPSRVREEASYLAERVDHGSPPKLNHPRGRLVNGKLELDFVPLNCDTPDRYCNQSDPPVEQMHAVTKAMFDEIIDTTSAKLAVLYTSGNNDDPVLRHLKQKEIPVVDLRLERSSFFVRDNISGYDGHPGPQANYYYYSVVRAFLKNNAR